MKPRRRPALLALCLAGLALAACAPNAAQLSGIYAGNLSDAADTTVETWLQLYSNGSFHIREIRYVVPTASKFREGRWSFSGSTVVLTVNGEKDQRFTWIHGFLRSEAAAAAHPDLPLDMVALQRIGQ